MTRTTKPAMKIWSVKACEEYWMQQDGKLYTTKEGALRSIRNAALVLDKVDHVIVVATDVRPLTAISRDPRSAKVPLTLENLPDYCKSFDFYDIIHQEGYELLGIFEEKVYK